jgi:cytochrome c oxidase cbb3-type subunit I/II
MWVSGITQGLMLSATREGGTVLAYPNFVDAVTSTKALMYLRAIGGTMYLAGFVICGWNIWKTAAAGEPVNGTIDVFVREKGPAMSFRRCVASPQVGYAVGLVVFTIGWSAFHGVLSTISFLGLAGTVLCAASHHINFDTRWGDWHDQLLANSLPFTLLTAAAVFVGGIVQIIPTVLLNKAEQLEGVRQIPYTPLELAGRDIYVSEGCYNCHSQMIRTLVGDVLRYGKYSKLGESVYDYPFQWGSKRTGPDLAREGGKYPSIWHYHHMMNPRQITPGSTMPNYPWLFTEKTDVEALPRKIAVQRRLGVPFPEYSPEDLKKSISEQEAAIVADLAKGGGEAGPDREIVALIAYLQKVGKAESIVLPKSEASTTASNP